MRTFLDDTELVEETRENIEKITQKLGNNTVAEELKNYGERILASAKKYGKEILNQIELELDDIEKYAKSLLEP